MRNIQGYQRGQVPQYEPGSQTMRVFNEEICSSDGVMMWAGKSAYCQGGVTPQLGCDEVSQKVSQVKGGSYVGRREGGIGYQKADPKTTHFHNFPTHPPPHLPPAFPPLLKALFSPDTPSELFLCNGEVTFTWKGPFLYTAYSVYLLADVVENVVGQVEVFQVLCPDKDLGGG